MAIGIGVINRTTMFRGMVIGRNQDQIARMWLVIGKHLQKDVIGNRVIGKNRTIII